MRLKSGQGEIEERNKRRKLWMDRYFLSKRAGVEFTFRAIKGL